jgi:hypothetical protein
MKRMVLVVIAAIALYLVGRYIWDETKGWRDEQEVYPCECHMQHTA